METGPNNVITTMFQGNLHELLAFLALVSAVCWSIVVATILMRSATWHMYKHIKSSSADTSPRLKSTLNQDLENPTQDKSLEATPGTQ